MIKLAQLIEQYITEFETKIDELRQVNSKCIDPEKFYAVKMSIPEVARLHGVDARTVKYYANIGAIEKHPDSTDNRTYIRVSVALSLDFSKLRKETRHRRG